ncbi:DUF6220 domain-containing protein [Neorhizobium tomejilense]|uniref:DUF6220 domain-containing protein n=1 Tax=Neorhizobium tomejilense TaxID=2093828 RepID=UPI000CF997CB|nr:DUF6220 domain-containing protein [Neorhizobium tomejilense]
MTDVPAGRTLLPATFRMLALAIPALIGGQVFLAGLAIFSDSSLWDTHGAFGGMLALPVLGLVGFAFLRPELSSYRASVLLLLGLYGLQFVFVIAGEGIGFVQALHPANAIAITVVSVLLARSAWSGK